MLSRRSLNCLREGAATGSAETAYYAGGEPKTRGSAHPGLRRTSKPITAVKGLETMTNREMRDRSIVIRAALPGVHQRFEHDSGCVVAPGPEQAAARPDIPRGGYTDKKAFEVKGTGP